MLRVDLQANTCRSTSYVVEAGTSYGGDSGMSYGADSGTSYGADTGTYYGVDAGTSYGADAGTSSGTSFGVDAGTSSAADAGTNAPSPEPHRSTATKECKCRRAPDSFNCRSKGSKEYCPRYLTNSNPSSYCTKCEVSLIASQVQKREAQCLI